MTRADRGDDSDPELDALLNDPDLPLEPVPPDLAARTRALIEAELRAMRPMSWRATLAVMFAASVVLVPGVAGLSDPRPLVLLGTIGLCGGYALWVRGMAYG